MTRRDRCDGNVSPFSVKLCLHLNCDRSLADWRGFRRSGGRPSMDVVEVASDECDACPASAHVKAFLYAELPSGRTLAYCAHHGTEHVGALQRAGAKIVDRRHLVSA